MPAYSNTGAYYPNAQTPMNNAPVVNLPYIQQPQAQQDYFVPVSSKMSADTYLIAPGSRVWMLNVNEGKLYFRSRGYQPDSMIEYKNYSIVEDPSEQQEEAVDEIGELKKMIASLTAELEAIKPVIEELKG